jgi:hypothetical protein
LPAAQKAKPLNEKEVIDLLHGGVPSARLAEIVNERGIGFEFTAQSEQDVRNAGGGDDAVAALRRASRRRAQPVASQAGGLIIKSSPGEAEVYLDDSPKGFTSREGDFRLPNLPPRSYSLRVSLFGYESFEQRLTIVAGEEQTVNVTLTQKSPTPPGNDNPSAPAAPSPGAVPASGIPVPGLKASAVRFYEGPHDHAPENSQRAYRDSFDRFNTRTVYWELDLSYPAPGRRIDFTIDAIWYRPDGSEITRQALPVHVDPEWGSSWHTLGLGYDDPGHWLPGAYRVDIQCRNLRVASGTFQIN